MEFGEVFLNSCISIVKDTILQFSRCKCDKRQATTNVTSSFLDEKVVPSYFWEVDLTMSNMSNRKDNEHDKIAIDKKK